MAKVTFNNIYKRFGEGRPAVTDLGLEIEDKELMVLVGPSGCGKTTSLRMLAGLETPSEGSIYIGEKDVTNVVPKDRDIAMVFQSYALYPHMSVRDNLSFGLKNRELTSGEKLFSNFIHFMVYLLIFGFIYLLSKVLNLIFPGQGGIFAASSIIAFILGLILYPDTRQVISRFALHNSAKFMPSIQDYLDKNVNINERIEETAKVLEIGELLDRKPKQLSGGQRQRVALGRAIIRNPEVFLMDEPLSNLDAKLRNQTRAELAALQKRLEVTTLYVTHDQVEAMTLGHRIAVMNLGVIEHVGTPEEVYGKPRTSFVAGFIGSPAMNLVKGKLSAAGDNYHVTTEGGENLKIPGNLTQAEIIKKWVGRSVTLGFRPEQMIINPPDDDLTMEGELTFSEPIGSITSLFLNMGNQEINIVEQGYHNYDTGEKVRFGLDPKFIHIFDNETTLRIELVGKEKPHTAKSELGRFYPEDGVEGN